MREAERNGCAPRVLRGFRHAGAAVFADQNVVARPGASNYDRFDVLNAEETIERAVTSALGQTWPEREIVIVDDGSTDRSATLLEELERMHHDIRLVRHGSNQGVAEARNTLLTRANGTFIAFFDDDDESAPERLEQQYRRLVEYEVTHPATPVFCYANRDVVQAGGLGPTSQRLGIGRRPPAPSGAMVADYVLGLVKDDGRHCWGMLGSCTLMARTEALRALGGFDGRFRRCAERDLAVRAALKGRISSASMRRW